MPLPPSQVWSGCRSPTPELESFLALLAARGRRDGWTPTAATDRHCAIIAAAPSPYRERPRGPWSAYTDTARATALRCDARRGRRREATAVLPAPAAARQRGETHAARGRAAPPNEEACQTLRRGEAASVDRGPPPANDASFLCATVSLVESSTGAVPAHLGGDGVEKHGGDLTTAPCAPRQGRQGASRSRSGGRRFEECAVTRPRQPYIDQAAPFRLSERARRGYCSAPFLLLRRMRDGPGSRRVGCTDTAAQSFAPNMIEGGLHSHEPGELATRSLTTEL